MKTIALDLPAFAFVVVTRAALAASIGLLVSGLTGRKRRSFGATLLGIGAAATIPAVISGLRGMRHFRSSQGALSVERDSRLIGTTRYPRKGDDPLD